MEAASDIPIANVQELQNEPSQVITDCLQTPVVLKRILQDFSNRELLQVSLVNKLWNYEARSVLKERGNVTATISFRSCQNLRAFETDLRQMNVCPFSGITIALDGTTHFNTCEKSTGELDPVYHVVVDRLKWNHLTVELTGSWKRCKNCPAFLLAKTILQDYGGHLEQGSFQLGSDQEEFIQDVLQACNFPRMKSLNLGWIDPIHLAPKSLIKALVSRTPALQEFRTQAALDLTENILEGTSAVLVRLTISPIFNRTVLYFETESY